MDPRDLTVCLGFSCGKMVAIIDPMDESPGCEYCRACRPRPCDCLGCSVRQCDFELE